MGYVGVSSINLIFTHCMGHCRSSFNPIKCFHSWLLIQFLDNVTSNERQTKLRKPLGPLIGVCCMRVCATRSIMNAGLSVVKEQGGSSRVSGSHTLGKQLEVSSCFPVLQIFFPFFPRLHAFPIIFLQGPAAC